jgi:hypothetical protein
MWLKVLNKKNGAALHQNTSAKKEKLLPAKVNQSPNNIKFA